MARELCQIQLIGRVVHAPVLVEGSDPPAIAMGVSSRDKRAPQGEPPVPFRVAAYGHGVTRFLLAEAQVGARLFVQGRLVVAGQGLTILADQVLVLTEGLAR